MTGTWSFNGNATQDKFIVESVTAFFEIATIRHLCNQVRSADQVPPDRVTRIFEFYLVEIEFLSCEVTNHAADGDVPRQPEIRQIAAQEICTS